MSPLLDLLLLLAIFSSPMSLFIFLNRKVLFS